MRDFLGSFVSRCADISLLWEHRVYLGLQFYIFFCVNRPNVPVVTSFVRTNSFMFEKRNCDCSAPDSSRFCDWFRHLATDLAHRHELTKG